MTSHVQLDPQGDAPVRDGHLLIETEVDFLQHAAESAPLHVRGKRVCDWAEVYYRARGYTVDIVHSPVSALRDALPFLSEEQAEAICIRIGTEGFQNLEQLSLASVLEALSTVPPLRNAPSREHAAGWLLWLRGTNPDPIVQTLLREQARQWSSQGNLAERFAYEAWNAEMALQALDVWLGIEGKAVPAGLSEFPLPVPKELRDRACEVWTKEILQAGVDFFRELLRRPLRPGLRFCAAEVTAKYYQSHPRGLDKTTLTCLEPYLSAKDFSSLQKLVPPVEPSPVPEVPADWIRWFQQDYLPYRRWQHATQDSAAREVILSLARRFALMYLTHYPQLVSDGKLLSFFQTAELSECLPSGVTLVLVLDGLGVLDAEEFVRATILGIERLSLLGKEFAYAPVPTVTEFAKEALLRGVPPCRSLEHGFLGEVVPENGPISDLIREAKNPSLYFWRLSEPDRTYHAENRARALPHRVEAALEAVVAQLDELVETLDASMRFQVVVTTDHGRLLGISTRRLHVPNGMTAHGRAAWGDLQHSFRESGHFEKDGCVFLCGLCYELDGEFAISLTEDSFLQEDGKGGSESYAHGGLFPEEVIIPWFVFERDMEEPKLEIGIDGSGQAGRTGTLRIVGQNQSRVALLCYSIKIGATEIDTDTELPPLSAFRQVVDFGPWPTKSQAHSATVTMCFRRPDGRTFERAVQAVLAVDEMYARDDSLLEGFDI